MLVPITQQKLGGSGCAGMASIAELEGFIKKNAIIRTPQKQLSDGEKRRFVECL